MFVTVYSYRAKESQARALDALHADWQRALTSARGCISCELLRNLDDPFEFIAIARFADEEDGWALTESPQYRAWYGQLVGLAEAGPSVSHYHLVRNNVPVASLGK